jgi:hypothetical protein
MQIRRRNATEVYLENLRPRHRREDNIKTDLKKTECENLDKINLVQDKVQLRFFVKKTIHEDDSLLG